MTHSDAINEIAAALAKAQGQIAGARKDAANPFFKSRYADLASVWDACRAALTAHGLAVIQSPSADGVRVAVDTLVTHASGQWVRGTITVSAKDESPQAIGSAITYLRRYALQSFVGVAPEDDDAEAAQPRNGKAKEAARPFPPTGYADWLLDLEAVADEGTAALQQTWQQSPAELRTFLTGTSPATWEAIKAKAAKTAKLKAQATA